MSTNFAHSSASAHSSAHSSAQSLLRLLQLVSPALPVGAFSYSEGLETIVQTGKIISAGTLQQWLMQELQYGAIRIEAAVLGRIFQCAERQDFQQLNDWNQWLSAFRETEELREQSWQMGRSLIRLLSDIEPDFQSVFCGVREPCNFTAAFAIAAACWRVDTFAATLGFLQSWMTNLVTAGVRLIPLGQTQGQKLLLDLYDPIEATAAAVMQLPLESLTCCSWGLTIASMNHETLYSRLFRS